MSRIMNKKKDPKQIFSMAIENFEPHQWEGYLVNACGEDEALRQKIRELLDAHRQADSFLDQNLNVTASESVSERAGTQIGPCTSHTVCCQG